MTAYTAPDGSPVDREDAWQMYRTRSGQAYSHGVEDAANDIERPHRTGTVYRPAYWRSYDRGQRDYREARNRNERQDRVQDRKREER